MVKHKLDFLGHFIWKNLKFWVVNLSFTCHLQCFVFRDDSHSFMLVFLFLAPRSEVLRNTLRPFTCLAVCLEFLLRTTSKNVLIFWQDSCYWAKWGFSSFLKSRCLEILFISLFSGFRGKSSQNSSKMRKILWKISTQA